MRQKQRLLERKRRRLLSRSQSARNGKGVSRGHARHPRSPGGIEPPGRDPDGQYEACQARRRNRGFLRVSLGKGHSDRIPQRQTEAARIRLLPLFDRSSRIRGQLQQLRDKIVVLGRFRGPEGRQTAGADVDPSVVEIWQPRVVILSGRLRRGPRLSDRPRLPRDGRGHRKVRLPRGTHGRPQRHRLVALPQDRLRPRLVRDSRHRRR